MQDHDRAQSRQKWAELRFSIIGPLIASPPPAGELKDALTRLAETSWQHPETDVPLRFGRSTIERWYYAARSAEYDTIGSLRRRSRVDRGRSKAMTAELIAALEQQYAEHRSWSYVLHAENLDVVAKERNCGPAPSVSTVRRWMKSKGLVKEKRRSTKDTEGARRSQARFDRREVRSYEADYVHALWHLDFHQGSRRVLLSEGRFATVKMIGILDDRSRLCCHGQWYLEETAEALVHGLVQAILKRGMPRALMTDRGAAMLAAETQGGLKNLSIDSMPTLAYSPYQNGKQEVFWASVEGRLMAMLEGERELSLDLLNEATQSWIERDYNRRPHSEIGMTPIERALEGPEVVRKSPELEELRRAFRQTVIRKQRRSDGTVNVEGRRFEVPSRLAHLESVSLRYARWDLATVDLWDPHEHVVLARLLPQDKSKNADRRRRSRESVSKARELDVSQAPGMAPLLRQMLEESRASGLPPAYLPEALPSADVNDDGDSNAVEASQ